MARPVRPHPRYRSNAAATSAAMNVAMTSGRLSFDPIAPPSRPIGHATCSNRSGGWPSLANRDAKVARFVPEPISPI